MVIGLLVLLVGVVAFCTTPRHARGRVALVLFAAVLVAANLACGSVEVDLFNLPQGTPAVLIK